MLVRRSHTALMASLLITVVSLLLSADSSLSAAVGTSKAVQEPTHVGGFIIDGMKGPWTPSETVVAADGTQHMVVLGSIESEAGLYYVRANGQTSPQVEKVSQEQRLIANPTIHVEDDGTVHIAWQELRDDRYEIVERSRTSHGWLDARQATNSEEGGAWYPQYTKTDGSPLTLSWTDAECLEAPSVPAVDEDRCSLENYLEDISGAVSPNNADGAFATTSTPRKIAFIGDGDLYLINEDASGLVRLTSTGAVSSFAWTKDGRYIAYVQYDKYMYGDLYLIDVTATSNVQRLTTGAKASRWVVDTYATKVAFLRETAVYPYYRIAYVDISNPATGWSDLSGDLENWGTGFTLLSRPRMRWSSSGDWIAISHGSINGAVDLQSAAVVGDDHSIAKPSWAHKSDSLLYPVTQPSSALLSYLPQTDHAYVLSYVSTHDAAYSPDDQYIAYATTSRLRRMDYDNTDHRTLYYGATTEPAWSPQGDKLAMANYAPGDPFPEYTGLTVGSADGSHSHALVYGHTQEPRWQPIAALRLLVVPLRWQGTQAAFNSEAQTQMDLFLNGVPLGSCRNRVIVETLDVLTQNYEAFTCSENDCAVGSVRSFVRDELNLDPAQYDVVIGLADESPCAPTMGCSNGTNTIWTTSEYDIVTAHELGHIYGLEDQYCSNQAGSNDQRCNDGDSQGDGAASGDVNWLDANLPCDCPPDGTDDSSNSPCCNFGGWDCSKIDYGICCLGNKNAAGGRSTMSFADAPGPRGFDSRDLAHLSMLPELRCETPSIASQTITGQTADYTQRVIKLGLRIRPDDSVVKESIAIGYGRPTSASTLDSLAGNYTIQIVDASDNIAWSQNFDINFDYEGPMLLGVDYSGIAYDIMDVSFRVPYSRGMNAVELYHGESMIFSEALPTMYWVYLPFSLRQ